MDCHFLLQGIFPTHGSNPGLLHCRQTLYCLSHQHSTFIQYQILTFASVYVSGLIIWYTFEELLCILRQLFYWLSIWSSLHTTFWTSLVAQTVKCLSTMQETRVQSLGQEDPLEKEMAIHSSTIAWKIPWTEEPGGLQSMGSQRV